MPKKDSMERIADALERIAAHYDQEREQADVEFDDLEDDVEQEPPKWLTAANVNGLGGELAEFAKKEIPESNVRWLDSNIVALFWSEKGLENKYSFPPKTQLLIRRVEIVAQNAFEKQRDEQTKKEKIIVPELATVCINWAQKKQLKRLNQADIKAILDEKYPELQPETIRTVWQQTNLELKS